MIRAAVLPLTGALLLGVGVAAALADRDASRGVLTVPCDDSVLHVPRSNAVADGYRLAFGSVAAPPAFVPGVGREPSSAPFLHWAKAGIWIRAGTGAVTVSVPKPWRDRVHVLWGNRGEQGAALRFAPCHSSVPTWNGYAGGFLLRSRSACFPLVFELGARRTQLRFGVGRRC